MDENVGDCSFSVDPSKDDNHKRRRLHTPERRACAGVLDDDDGTIPSQHHATPVPVFWNVPSPTSSRFVMTDRPIQTVRPPFTFIFILIQREKKAPFESSAAD